MRPSCITTPAMVLDFLYAPWGDDIRSPKNLTEMSLGSTRSFLTIKMKGSKNHLKESDYDHTDEV